MRVKSNGAVVLVPRFGIEGPVYVAPKGTLEEEIEREYRYDEKGMALIHLQNPSRSLRVFDEVKVKIEVVETGPHRKALSMSLFWEGGVGGERGQGREKRKGGSKRGSGLEEMSERASKRRKS